MEKVKYRRSLVRVFLFYLTAGMILAFSGSLLIGKMTNLAQDRFIALHASAPESGEVSEIPMRMYDENGEFIAIIRSIISWRSSRDEAVYNLISGSQFVLIPAWVLLCLFATVGRFYVKRLKKPLSELLSASEKIAAGELNFSMGYASADEIGQLCASFETMRGALEQNNRALWRQMEERKRVNAAFAHDLRTPLTVLKGRCELLIKFLRDGDGVRAEASARVLQSNMQRLEAFVENMKRLERLEDLEVKKEQVSAEELSAELRESAEALLGDKLVWEALCPPGQILRADRAVISEVFENLAANADRFAKHTVSVSMTNPMPDRLILTVSDDGPGYDQKLLEEPPKPLYTTGGGEHLGIGLYICKILCEKHGGGLTLSNTGTGAKAEAYFSLL